LLTSSELGFWSTDEENTSSSSDEDDPIHAASSDDEAHNASDGDQNEAWQDIRLKKVSDVHLMTLPVLTTMMDQCEREWRAVFHNVRSSCSASVFYLSKLHFLFIPTNLLQNLWC
jgi:hypothetical protein